MNSAQKSLVEKLGIKPEYCITIINPPDGFEDKLGDLPDSVRVENFLEEVEFDLINYFAESSEDLEQQFEYLKNCLNKDGVLWVSWKKPEAHGRLNEESVKSVGESGGLVAKTTCDLDKDWCATKFTFSK